MLRTDYKDDVFSGKRKYNMINNNDGTVSFIDVTVYSQVGDVYAAQDVNTLHETINNMNGSEALIVSNTVTPVAQRSEGKLYFFYS